MRKAGLLLSMVSLLMLVLVSGCKKEGCTDPDSKNYDPEAKVDDHSCQYEGSVVFWYNKTTSDSLMSYDAQSLTIYVDNQVIGSYATNVYFTSQPDCSTQSVVTTTKDLGPAKSKSYSYKVVDDDGYTWWQGNINIDANTCLALELQWSSAKSHKIKK